MNAFKIVCLIVLLSSCGNKELDIPTPIIEDTSDYRDKYIGEWIFENHITSYSPGSPMFDTSFTYQGNIYFDTLIEDDQIVINFNVNSFLKLTIDKEGELTDFPPISYGNFVGTDTLYIYIRSGGIGMFSENNLDGIKSKKNKGH